MDTEGHESSSLVIHIDDKEYRALSSEMTGSQLRELPKPAIGPDRDLWLEVPGGHDALIENQQLLKLRDGMHFFTAPAIINPGLDACAS